MEIFSQEPIDSKDEAQAIELSVNNLEIRCAEVFLENGYFDDEEFLGILDQLEGLHEELNEIVANTENIDPKILNLNYRSIARISLLLIRLELYGGSTLFDKDAFYDDIEFEEFNADDILDLIEAAKRSEDYIFLKEIVDQAIYISESVIQEEDIKEELIHDIYALLEDQKKELDRKHIIDADSKIHLEVLMNEIYSKYKNIFPDHQITMKSKKP
ncbi:hypothetical protein KKD70_04655 [Patescibacteria group bacterium]|nr:hypothetical protein [Patescibacteria group bacterium]